MKKLFFGLVAAIIAIPAGAAPARSSNVPMTAEQKSRAAEVDNIRTAWLDPYIAMRASYIHLAVEGSQDVYSAPLGVVGPLVSSEKFDVNNDNGFGVKLAFGGSANMPEIFGRIRIEAEYADNGAFITPVASEGGNVLFDTKNTTMFGNVYYALATGTRFSPYVGAGLGLTRFASGVNFSSGAFNAQMAASEYKFAWNVGAGLSMYLARGVSVDLGYRFSDFGRFVADLDVSRYAVSGGNVLNGVVLRNHVNMDFLAHEIILGIRYRL
ncbi:MAG: outer membrane beta-barrel protein [Proteobacteria bacterium]|nr:outer membrane beta-barrel protein [Pseudomonadota bacterium]